MKLPSLVVEHITRRAEWKSVYYAEGAEHAGGHYAEFSCGCEHEIRDGAPIDENWLLCWFHEGMRVHTEILMSD